MTSGPADSADAARDPRSGRAGAARIPLIALGALASALGLNLGSAGSTEATIDVGPNDARYVRGFRDVERDGPAYVRWSLTPESRILWPLRVCGDGVLSLRVRRHFVEPAAIAILVDDMVVGRQTVAAGGPEAFRVISFSFSKSTCHQNAQVVIRTESSDGRGLGTTIDWVRVSTERDGLPPSLDSVARWAASALLITGVLAGLGTGSLGLLLSAAVWGVGSAAVAWLDPVLAERIGRAALPAAMPVVFVAVAIRVFSPRGAPWVGSALVAALAGGATLLPFLAQSAFYPDYWVHGLVTRHLASAGLPAFVENLFAIQYERSLGLQEIGGRWYPFPYPPGFYLLPAAYNLYFDLSSVEAVVAAGIAAVGLLSFGTTVLGRVIGAPQPVALLAGLVVALAPIVSRRQALGYFPGLLGFAVDTLALAALCHFVTGNAGIRSAFALTLGLLGAFLVYTQSLLNFGLVGLVAVAAVAGGVGRSRMTRVALVLAAAAALAMVSFYGKYLVVFSAIGEGRSLPEELILERLEAVRSARLPLEQLAEEPNDPFAADGVSPARAVRKALHRTGLFFGPFGAFFWIGLVAFWRMARDRSTEQKVVLAAWALTFPLVIMLTSALPGPNGFRHLKDLEAITPLLAIGLASTAIAPAPGWRRWLGFSIVAGWFAVGIAARGRELAERMLVGPS